MADLGLENMRKHEKTSSYPVAGIWVTRMKVWIADNACSVDPFVVNVFLSMLSIDND